MLKALAVILSAVNVSILLCALCAHIRTESLDSIILPGAHTTCFRPTSCRGVDGTRSRDRVANRVVASVVDLFAGIVVTTALFVLTGMQCGVSRVLVETP